MFPHQTRSRLFLVHLKLRKVCLFFCNIGGKKKFNFASFPIASAACCTSSRLRRETCSAPEGECRWRRTSGRASDRCVATQGAWEGFAKRECSRWHISLHVLSVLKAEKEDITLKHGERLLMLLIHKHGESQTKHSATRLLLVGQAVFEPYGFSTHSTALTLITF